VDASTIHFVPGLQLSERFFTLAVAPVLQKHFPRLRYGAGRLGRGSEVLGFDTPRSMDHDWGPQCGIFVSEADYSEQLAAEIQNIMAAELPFEVDGFPTHFALHEDLSGHLQRIDQRPIAHRVRISTVRRFLERSLSVNALDETLTPKQWLTMPEQTLRCIASGAVFRDDLGELEKARAILRWYPYDVWLYILAAQWRRIGQEEAFVGRCAEVGDELGSRIVAARLVRELMHLCLLMERRYAPYSKWFGSAFSRLECAPHIGPSLEAALSANDFETREQHLTIAYQQVAELHNALHMTEPLPVSVSNFHTRPFKVIHADRFCEAIRNLITDPEVKKLPRHVGSANQWVDATDVLDRPHSMERLRRFYEE
jgi:Domain of unknown function (DUF4037)